MLAESSGVAIDLDLDAIEPPAGVALERWLKTFPSYGFLLSTAKRDADSLIARFRERDIHAAAIGEVRAGHDVALVSGSRRAIVRDWRRDQLLGFSSCAETAA